MKDKKIAELRIRIDNQDLIALYFHSVTVNNSFRHWMMTMGITVSEIETYVYLELPSGLWHPCTLAMATRACSYSNKNSRLQHSEN